MIDVYVEIEYSVTNCKDFDREFDRVADSVLDLDQVSEKVFDTSPGGNISTQRVTFTCFAKGESVDEAVSAAEQLVRQGISNVANSTWTWIWTNAFDYEADLDYDKAIYTSGVAVS